MGFNSGFKGLIKTFEPGLKKTGVIRSTIL